MSRFNCCPPGLAFWVIVFAAIWFFPVSSWAADLILSSTYSDYQVGDNVKVTVLLAAPGESANAASGVIIFPTDKLAVVSISKDSSIFNLWVQEPTYSNSLGQVKFEGVILNPGFTGSAGRLVTVFFKAKEPGTAELFFQEGAILANDGQGTSLLKKLGRLPISITPAKVESAPKKELPPTIIASTSPPIDITPPQLEINEVKMPAGNRARFAFVGRDLESGIDRYEFQLDGSNVQTIWPDETNIYNTPLLSAGAHLLMINVFDKAGNRLERQLNFSLDLPISASFWVNWGRSTVTLTLWSIIIPAICLLIILLILLIIGWRKIAALEEKLRRAGLEARDHLYKIGTNGLDK